MRGFGYEHLYCRSSLHTPSSQKRQAEDGGVSKVLRDTILTKAWQLCRHIHGGGGQRGQRHQYISIGEELSRLSGNITRAPGRETWSASVELAIRRIVILSCLGPIYSESGCPPSFRCVLRPMGQSCSASFLCVQRDVSAGFTQGGVNTGGLIFFGPPPPQPLCLGKGPQPSLSVVNMLRFWQTQTLRYLWSPPQRVTRENRGCF